MTVNDAMAWRQDTLGDEMFASCQAAQVNVCEQCGGVVDTPVDDYEPMLCSKCQG